MKRVKIEWGVFVVGLFIGHVIGGCIFPRPPAEPPPLPPPEVVMEGATFEGTPIIFELFAGSIIVELPSNGTLTVNTPDGPKVLTEDDLPYLLVDKVEDGL